MSRPELAGLPRDAEGEPVFAAPWQAEAFALAVALNEKGLFGWGEWAEALGREIALRGDTGDPEAYYQAWLAALEAIVAAKGLLGPAELAARREAWDRAARATPHGEPIELGRDTVQTWSGRHGNRPIRHPKDARSL